MNRIIRTLSTEQALAVNTANTVANAHLVRLLPSSNALITVSNGVVQGTFTALGGQETFVSKAPHGTVSSNVSGVLAVSVAF